MKKMISTVVLVSLIATLGSSCASAKNDGIKVMYDGTAIEFDVQPEIIDDRVMVPMRTIFETFGMKVKWDGDAQTITAKRKSKTVGMTIGSTDMTKNEDTYSFDTAPVIADGRTLVPVRAISDLLGLDVEWNADEKTVEITTPTDEEDEAWKENTGTINLDKLEATGDGVSVEGNVITVSVGGDFEVTGTLDDGQIVIDTEDKVKLRLSGMSLTNKNGSAVYIKNADKAYITITENTDNTLADGENYTSGDEKEKACITSRDNLEIKGKGTLTVNGNYKHGIDGSDSVEIGNGNITVNAKADGIHVNDTLAISGGNVTVVAESDGLQADEIVDITGGTINVTTTGEVTASTSGEFGGRGHNPQDMSDEEKQSILKEMQKAELEADNSEDVTSKGIKADWMLDISGGEITVNSTDHAIHCASDINIKGGTLNLASEMKKGIAAHGNIVIDDGEIDITKATEGIETKQIMTINGGDINIIASDDGLNAGGGSSMIGGGQGGMGRPDGEQRKSRFEMQGDAQMPSEEGVLMPKPAMPEEGDMQEPQDGMQPPQRRDDGEMQPPQGGMQSPQRHEGGQQMTPPDGEIQQPPNDDNAQDGIPHMGGGGFGMGSNAISTERHIQINGGNIYINAKNDGVDSNGSIVIDGGTIVIEGTPLSGGGELGIDSDMATQINGGEVFASGGSMASLSGTQNTVVINFGETMTAGSVLTIKNSSGKTIASLTADADFRTMLYSSDKLETNKEYSVYIGNEQKETFTVTDITTKVGTASNAMGGGFGGGHGGGRGGREMKDAQPENAQ